MGSSGFRCSTVTQSVFLLRCLELWYRCRAEYISNVYQQWLPKAAAPV